MARSAAFSELTERKRCRSRALRASEAELQSVINRTPFMLVRCGRDLRYRFVSEAYAHLIDCERDAVIGKSIDESDWPARFQCIAAAFYRCGSCKARPSISNATWNFRAAASAGSPSPTRPELDSRRECRRLDCPRFLTSPISAAANRRAGSSPTSSNRPTMRLSARILTASSSAGIPAPSVCSDIRPKK